MMEWEDDVFALAYRPGLSILLGLASVGRGLVFGLTVGAVVERAVPIAADILSLSTH